VSNGVIVVGETNVIANFVIYAADRIVVQGSFQVSESINTVSFLTGDGIDVTFAHSFEGAECSLEVFCSNNGENIAARQLTVPINHTKLRWKQANLGSMYVVYYRCSLEDWSSGKLLKKMNKMRGKDAMKRNARSGHAIIHAGPSEGDEAGVK
jgi:hypothetical protein